MARGNSQSYEGRVPPAKGTGPKNLAKKSSPVARGPAVRASRAAGARIKPSLASAGKGAPPRAGGAGTPKVTSPMASAAKKSINKPKTGQPRRSKRLGKPRADFPSKI